MGVSLFLQFYMLMIFCWLAVMCTCLLNETKGFLLKHFDMKDIGEARYVLGIKIVREKKKDIAEVLS